MVEISKKACKNGDFIVEEVTKCDDAFIRQLIHLEEKCSPLEMQNADSFQYFSNVLKNPSKIALVLKYKNKVVGFLFAEEYKKIYKKLANHDPDMEKDKNRFFYIETVQIHPRYKRNSGLRLLVYKLFKKAIEKGLRGFCVHARTKNGLSALICRYFKGKRLHSIDNWLGFSERFDYMEVAVNKNVLGKQLA